MSNEEYLKEREQRRVQGIKAQRAFEEFKFKNPRAARELLENPGPSREELAASFHEQSVRRGENRGTGRNALW